MKKMREPWKGTMTQRERFYNQMHYLPFDRTVNMEFGYWEENYKSWPMFEENGITNERQANEFFSFEPPVCVGGSIWMHPAFEEKVISQTHDKIISINGDGLYHETLKSGGSTIPRFIKASIQTPNDWKRVKQEHFARGDFRKPDTEKIKSILHPERDHPVGVNVGSMIGKIRDMMTLEGLAFAVFDYPEMVEDMVETACVLVEDSLDEILPLGQFDFAFGWEDICCKNGPLVSMDFFVNAVVPRYKRIGKKLHDNGIDIWYLDCDGDVHALLPYFLESGINCLFPYEVNSCAHPSELLEEYGKELRIMGGFDKMKMIEGKQAIKKYMDSIAPYVQRGGFIPFCDHRCPPDVSQENYLYYLDIKKEYFGLK
ncbi:MAG TPA: uroporphyrinogen decarboxylase family protein [Clostridia bacterium]|nr:uroporphyrinogen decarboxylase family protein [Clostridia bacterium]